MIAINPEPPYYAVIFTSLKTQEDNGYSEMANTMHELAKKQPGFLGLESARENIGITVSYWRNKEAIKRWKTNTEHSIAREKGRKIRYTKFKVRICKVEKEYSWERG